MCRPPHDPPSADELAWGRRDVVLRSFTTVRSKRSAGITEHLEPVWRVGNTTAWEAECNNVRIPRDHRTQACGRLCLTRLKLAPKRSRKVVQEGLNSPIFSLLSQAADVVVEAQHQE